MDAGDSPPLEGTDLPDLLRQLGVVVFRRAADSTLRFLEVSGPCAERMGLSTTTLTGDAYSFWTRVDPVDRRRVLATLEEAIRKSGTYRVAYQLQAPNGTIHRVREEGAACVDSDGSVVSLSGVILEAADELGDARREKALACLQESEERFRVLAEQSSEMIAEVSADRLFSYASPRVCAELGRSEAELRTMDPLTLVHPEDRDNLLAICRESLRTGEVDEVLCRLARADGSWLWVELGGRSFHGAAGDVRGLITGRNVENRTRVEEAFLTQRVSEARIGKLSRRFIELGPEGLDEAIDEGLEAAAAIAGADRCYLLAFRSRRPEEARSYVWQREGLAPWSANLRQEDGDRNAWMRDKLISGEIVKVPRTRELPDEFAAAREAMLALGTQSFLAIPVRSSGRLTGLLCFQSMSSERDWNEQELALLRLVAELFDSALHRREVEGALLEGEQRLRALTDGAEDAICEAELERGEILYANPYFYEMHGVTAEEARGVSAFEFMHPEDLERIHSVHRAFECGALGETNSGTMLYRGLHKDGSWRWLEAKGRLFRTASGEARSAAVIRDVTEREVAQKAMERQLKNQHRIANMARDLLALGPEEIDAGLTDGLASLLSISRVDRCWLVSIDPAREGEDVWEWAVDGIPEPEVAMDRVVLSDYPHASQLFAAGRELLVSPEADLPADSPELAFLERRGSSAMLVIPLLSASTLVGAVGFEVVGRVHDWTDETVALLRLGGEVFVSAISRRRSEEALRESRGQLLQAQKMEAVGTLAGGVAHDFNNQLSVILGNARFVLGEVRQEPDLREAMVDLERAGEHCAQLTRSLLSFSRNTPAAPCATSVAQVLLEVRELTGPLLTSAIHLETSAHDDQAAVFVDRTQLQQVLVNLVVNARDAMPEGGNLSIRTNPKILEPEEEERLGLSDAREYVEFVVRDDGSGMGSEILSRIFEPFFTTKEQGKGTGLGLAMVYGILKESGGTISTESTLGVGTTFRILLPRARRSRGEFERG